MTSPLQGFATLSNQGNDLNPMLLTSHYFTADLNAQSRRNEKSTNSKFKTSVQGKFSRENENNSVFSGLASAPYKNFKSTI